MVEGEVFHREGGHAVLAGERIPQEDIEAREGGAARERAVALERDHARQPDRRARRADRPVISGEDRHPVEKRRLDRVLPTPDRKREIAERPVVGVEHQGWAALQRCLHGSKPPKRGAGAPAGGPFATNAPDLDGASCQRARVGQSRSRTIRKLPCVVRVAPGLLFDHERGREVGGRKGKACVERVEISLFDDVNQRPACGCSSLPSSSRTAISMPIRPCRAGKSVGAARILSRLMPR